MLAQKRVSMKIKDFHTYDDYFKPIIQPHIITICIYHQSLIKINDLQTQLFENDWSNLIAPIEGQYLNSGKVQNFHDGVEINVLVNVATKLSI